MMSVAAGNRPYPAVPPLLLATGLLFWGWRTELLPFAILMAILLEAPRWLKLRWSLSDQDLNRLADISGVLLFGIIIYLFSKFGSQGIFVIIQWLPMVLLLLVSAQFYSERGDISLASLFLSLRRSPEGRARRVDLAYPYLALCLLSAASTSLRDPWFYPLLVAISAWALYQVRPRRYPLVVWLVLVLLAGALGYAGQLGMRQMQLAMEELILSWFQDRIWARRDPYRANTAIGDIGRLKLSNRILLRVESDSREPVLLRQASYRSYSYGTWQAGNSSFEELAPGSVAGVWRIDSAKPEFDRLRISGSTHRGRALLALPAGAWQIEDLLVGEMQANELGAVKALEGPGLVRYRVRHSAPSRSMAAPERVDLSLPQRDTELLNSLAREIGLDAGDASASIGRLRRFFADGFLYSLRQEERGRAGSPLARFLTETRTGHCEYFASATVLLMRAAGIPARYATGYSAQEYSELEDAFVVRRRHAHSWALVYVDGQWRDVDLTPAGWAPQEADAAPWWEGPYDLLSRLAFGFDVWRWQEDEDEEESSWYLWAIPPLLILLIWRLSQRQRVRPGGTDRGSTQIGDSWPGSQSPFYRVMGHLEQDGRVRLGGESLRAWLRRLHDERQLPGPPLAEALELHYRLRFDPAGTSDEDRQRLRSLVEDWIAHIASPRIR